MLIFPGILDINDKFFQSEQTFPGGCFAAARPGTFVLGRGQVGVALIFIIKAGEYRRGKNSGRCKCLFGVIGK